MGSAMHRGMGLAAAIGVMISADVARGEPSIAPANDGIGTTVQQQGDRYDIGGGTRAGNNLFHSFQRLGLSSQEIANFLATPDLNAIVGRVTGGNPSVIDGLIRVSGGSPNLYLMNPAGIVFGAGARLDVPASFTATTATSLGFSDGGWFPATGAVDFAGLGGSLSWLEFASLRPGSLVNAGQLTVPAGQSLWLISGNTTLSSGTLRSAGGNVVVTAVPGTNRLRIAPDGSTLSLEVIPPNPEAMTGRSLPELLAGGQLTSASQLVTNPDGSVSLQSPDGPVPLPDRGTVVSGAIDVSSTTGQGGNVTIAGDRVGLLGATIGADGATGGGQIQIGGSERGNGAVFAARTTLFDRFSQVSANATMTGNGGRIVVWADGLTWFGGSIAARGGPFGGNGGFAEVSGKQDLAIRGTADLSAPQGAIGTLLLDPRDIIIAATTDAQSQQLSVNVPLDQAEGQILSADVDTSSGALDFTISEGSLESLSSSANIVLEAQRDIVLQDLPDNMLDLPTGTGSSVRFQAGRNIQAADTTDLLSTRGGSLTLQAGESLAIGPVSTSGGAVSLTAGTTGTTGNLTTAGGDLTIATGGGLTTGALTTSGGNLSLTSTNGYIYATGRIDTSGNTGGNITLSALQWIAAEGGLNASSESGAAGNVSLTSATGAIITNTPGEGRDSEGFIVSSIRPKYGDINASGSTQGGSITLSASEHIRVGRLDTSSGSGAAGNVNITSQNNYIFIRGDINADGGTQGGNVTLSSRSGIHSGYSDADGYYRGPYDISANGNTQGGNITLSSKGDQIAGNLDTSSESGTAGNITISGRLIAGNLDTSSESGTAGNITISGYSTAGNVDTSSESGTAGNITISGYLLAGNVDTSSESGTAGNITISGYSTAGNLDTSSEITTSGGLTAGNVDTSSESGAAGNITIAGSSNAGNVDTSSESGTAGNITISGNLRAGNVDTSSESGTAGNITISDSGYYSLTETGNLDTSSGSGAAGNITLTGGEIRTGNINATGRTQGGTLQARSSVGMTLGTIDLSSSVNNGGNATLTITRDTFAGDIQIRSLNAQGGTNGIGGSVTITVTRFFQAIGTFIDRTGQLVSIATGGGTGGNSVVINHSGTGSFINVGNTNTTVTSDATITQLSSRPYSKPPLIVGQVPNTETGNGLAGGISTGSSTITSGSFPDSFTKGNIQFVVNQSAIGEYNYGNYEIFSGRYLYYNQTTGTYYDPGKNIHYYISSYKIEQTATGTITDITFAPVPNLDFYPESQLNQMSWAVTGANSLTLNQEKQEYDSRRTVEATLDGDRLDQAVVEIDRLYTTLTNVHLNRALSNQSTSFPELQARLSQLQQQTGLKPAILYTFARPEQLDVILVVPDAPPIYRTVREAQRHRVLEAVNDLRAAITSPAARLTNSYRQPAEQLYRWIVGPVAEDLVKHNINTIAFSMDRGMRSLPVSVLHSGQEFLIERYSVGLIPSISLTDTQFTPINAAPVLSFGASEFSDMPPLPAVPIELATINRLITTDQTFLNEEFNLENLKRQRRANPFPVLHFATHADFRPGAPDHSFVRLWDRRLAITELRSLGLSDPPVELLVLSACRTAIGDETAELGFAGLAVETGVESVLASLWYVSDEGTLGLMASFYDALRSAPIKAEALRRAQLAMLRGETRAENGLLVFPGGSTPLPAQLGESASFSLSHPYYWASFTAIGSPW